MYQIAILLPAMLLNFASGDDNAISQCNRILPQKDADWEQLAGSWYHLMFVPGGQRFLNCRKMKISNVNTKEQVVYIDFDDVTPYQRNPKFYRDASVYFKWNAHPGVIYTAVNPVMNYKQSYKTFQRRKSLFKNFLGSKTTSYTMVATDYSNYVILTKCSERGGVQVWVSIKEIEVESQLANAIRGQLSAVGIDAGSLEFNTSSQCSG